MKLILLFAVILSVTPVSGQNVFERSSNEMLESQLFTVVVTNVDTFTYWALQQQIQVAGIYHPANIVVLQTTARLFMEKIVRNPMVLYAVHTPSNPKLELSVPGHNIFVNKINVAQASFPQLNGSGSVVSIREFRFDTLDVDLLNRVLPSQTALLDLETHASFMATLAGGAGNSDLAGKGAAPGCLLRSSGYNLFLPEEDYASQLVTVQNHSYGVEIENFYGPNALAYDISSLENPGLLHVFSAGNKGAASAPSGAYTNVAGFATLTGNFKMAKNVLTVGAVDSLGERSFFSSKGPAYDGRVKPDLVAFGNDGTSGAAALVSGSIAVLQQALQEQFDTIAASETLRAVLINSADDHGPEGPDYSCGFGNLNLKNALKTIVDQQVLTLKVAEGETKSFVFEIPDNIREVKFTLVWNDVPALPGAAKALVHDLDFSLVNNLGQTWLPWVLNASPHADSLNLPAVRAIDTLNNVEQITLSYPTPGVYELLVYGAHITSGTQSFSIAYAMDTVGHFEWTYPIGNDPAVAANTVVLGWETNIAAQFGRLEWKIVGEDDWLLLDSSAVLKSGSRRWILPDTFAEAQVRMAVNAQTYVSDTFLISKELRLKIGFNCPDSLGLFWSPAAASAEYQLFGLGDLYMEPLLITRDTFLVLKKSAFPQPRFAVATLGNTHASLGKRSAAPDIRQQGVECYQKSFFATLNEEDEVDISLLLGTTYGVTKVQFEKWDGTGFAALKTFENNLKESFLHTDLKPVQGRNAYRVVIFTSNGAAILTDTATVYFAGENGWLVFPNPVSSGGTLEVLVNGSGEATFTMFDALGQMVLTQTLDEYRKPLSLPHLPKGVYFFDIRENGLRLGSGVVVVDR